MYVLFTGHGRGEYALGKAVNNDHGWLRMLSVEEIGMLPVSRIAYVTGATGLSGTQYYVLTTFTDAMAPTDSYCSTATNGACSVLNSRALVGHALAQLALSPSVPAFEEILRDISYSRLYRVDSGFYIFAYKMGAGNRGECVAHGANQRFVGKNLQVRCVFPILVSFFPP